MALQVWLPLNGNLENRGLQNVTISNNGATVSSNGKIGGCYSVGNGKTISTVVDIAAAPISASVWVYLNSFHGSYNYIFSLNTADGYSNQCIAITLESATQIAFVAGGVSSLKYTLPSTLVGRWVHLAITFDGSYIKGYVDGTKVAELASTAKLKRSNLMLGSRTGSTAYYTDCQLNDFRLYDHCLTPKEVHEISRGLIVHYKLDSVDVALSKCTNVTWNQQIVYGSFSDGLTGWSRYAATVSVSNHIITITKNSTGSGGLLYQVITRKNHKYYFKGTMRLVEDPGDDSTKFMALGFSNNASVGNNPSVTIHSSEWTTVSGVGTPDTESTVELRFCFRVGASVSPVGLQGQAKYAMLIDLTQMFGAGNEPSKEECDKIFCQDVYDNNQTGTVKNLAIPITDHSGNGWMPTVKEPSLSNIGLEGGSPRYDCYTRFGTTPYLDLESPTAEARSASFWIKINSKPSSNHLVFVDYKSRLAFGLHINSTTDALLCGCNSSDTYDIDQTNFVYGEWNHIVVVKTGSSNTSTARTLYINGVQQNSLSTKSHWAHNVDKLQVGRRSYSNNPTGNNISDFRLYATALTQEDVLDLYHTSAIVNNDGSLHTFQAKEESTEPEITVTGSTTTREFVEITDNEYLYLPSNVCVPITDATYSEGDVLEAKTVLRYATGGSGRDLMGLNTSGCAYWGVYSDGTWETHGYASYTDQDITVKNTIIYNKKISSGEAWGHYTIGMLYTGTTQPYGYSARNKYIYHVSLYKNGVLIKDLYPMKEGSYCGLYDIVSGTFYPCNDTAGVLGSDSGSPVLSVYKDKIETSNVIEI